MGQENERAGSSIPQIGVTPVSVAGKSPVGSEALDDISILFVDDEQQLLSVLSSRLQEEFESLEVVTAKHGTQAVERLEAMEVDCIVSDYRMPGMDGLELLEKCRAHDPDIPFILFTSRGSEDVATEAINAGVTDYLQKNLGDDRVKLLANRIENAVIRYRAKEESRETYQHIRRIHDRISDAFLGMDPDWVITYVDEQGAELLGRTQEALLGRNFWDVFPEATDTSFKRQYERAMETGEPVSFEAHHEPFDAWFEVRAFPSEDGLSTYFRDVSERKQLESELAAHRDRLRDTRAAAEKVSAVASRLVSELETARERSDPEAADPLDAAAERAETLEGYLEEIQTLAAPVDESSADTEAGSGATPDDPD
jgi:PAS domain S-box-containing protein